MALNCFMEKGQWELRIDFQFENGTRSYVHYTNFSIGRASEEYPITIGGFTGITPADPFVAHPLNGQRFSTSDNDRNSGNCATSYGSGWWHNSCYQINPNSQPPYVHLNYKDYNMLSMEMKIHPRDCIIQ